MPKTQVYTEVLLSELREGTFLRTDVHREQATKWVCRKAALWGN